MVSSINAKIEIYGISIETVCSRLEHVMGSEVISSQFWVMIVEAKKQIWKLMPPVITPIMILGLANWLFDAFNFDYERIKYKPHAIVGDLDSIRPEVKNFYDTCGSSIVQIRN